MMRNAWRRSARPIVLVAIALLAPWATHAQEAPSLARYVPAEGLTVLLDHEGLEARPAAWHATAAYRMLTETSLGAMLRDIATQVADRSLQSAPGAPIDGKDLVEVLTHVASRGAVVGYCGPLNAPAPKAGVVAVRDGGKNAVIRRLVERLSAGAKQVAGSNGRKVWTIEGAPARWWFEKDDLVISLGPPGAADPIADVLDGKAANALKHPVYASLAQAEPGIVPVGVMFVDLGSLPPMPPDATRLGLDGTKRVEARWGLAGRAVTSTLGVHAPRPRRGVLALFDQPALGDRSSFAAPKGMADSTLLSIDPARFGDALVALMQQGDPNAAASMAQFAERFRARTGMDLRKDVLGKIGPRMAIAAPPGGGFGNIVAMWLSPPDLGIVAELKDPQGFAATLDRLVEAANAELKTAGAMVPPQPGQPARPGTSYAEFRRLKPPERGYILAVPPSVLPIPARFRPTVLIDAQRGRLAIAASPTTARAVLPALTLDPAAGRHAGGRGTVMLAKSDPSGSLPELLVNLPPLVQFVGFAANQPGPGRPGGRPFRLQIDPDTIPDAEAIRPHLFASTYAITTDDQAIRFTATTAFPLPVPQLNAGMEAPVLIALLLPAVQSAREAARRAQCTNNEKQIGLALHNYASVKDGVFPPPAILDKEGKPLLSWRVAILPYLEQQALYDQFHLDEPWDSPHNKTLIAKMPNVYLCPSRKNPETGTTTYRAFAGRGTAFDDPKGTRFADVTDGLSNTLGVIEAKEAVAWTRPDDLPFDPKADGQAALGQAGSNHPSGFNALILDGSVRFFKSTIAADVFKAMITRNGGEIIQGNF